MALPPVACSASERVVGQVVEGAMAVYCLGLVSADLVGKVHFLCLLPLFQGSLSSQESFLVQVCTRTAARSILANGLFLNGHQIVP